MKTFVILAVAAVVLFAPMVGVARVEAGGLGDFFNGNSPMARTLGSVFTGAAAGASAEAVCGTPKRGGSVLNTACKGAVAAGTVQVIQEMTDNVPISCGSEPVYRDPRTGAIYCGGSGGGSPSVATPPFFPQPQVVIIPGGGGHGGYHGGRCGSRCVGYRNGFEEEIRHAEVDAMYRAMAAEDSMKELRQQARWKAEELGRLDARDAFRRW